MCKEDIRLARAASTKNTVSLAAPAAAVKLMPADPNRYSLAAGIGVLTPLTLNVSCLVAALVGGAFVPLIGLSADSPNGHVSVIDVGQLIFAEIWFVPGGSDPPTNLYVGDTSFDRTLESI